MEFSTLAIRVGQEWDGQFHAVVQPIYQSSTFGWSDLATPPPHDYTRCGNPNRSSLEAVIAALEGGRHCVLFGSGMAAITGALSILEQGDHMLMASDIYGGTHRLCHKLLVKYGIHTTEFDAQKPCTIRELVQPNTKLLIFEGPTNPNLRVVDIQAIVNEAKALGLVTVFDNTFASPALQRPLEYGVDIVVHSTTKYISGHSDVIGGAVVTNDESIRDALAEYSKTVGNVPSPFDCWLTLRGVKSLGARMRIHCENAMAVAEFLESNSRIAKVHYPGLKSHPQHALAARQMKDGFGGMIAFEVAGSPAQAIQVAESLKIILLGESLGAVESLLGYPPLMSHAGLTEEERVERGIPPTLLRLSVGIEDPRDLIADLKQALTTVFKPTAALAGV